VNGNNNGGTGNGNGNGNGNAGSGNGNNNGNNNCAQQVGRSPARLAGKAYRAAGWQPALTEPA
jgi:hypothetical protein